MRWSVGAIEEGAQAREQALERARLILQQARARSTPSARPGLARGAMDPRPDRRGPCRGRGGLGAFDFAAATGVLYHLTFDDFCDWYLEAIKPRLYEGDEDAARPRSRRSSGCCSSSTR